jgi:hypothetical protein
MAIKGFLFAFGLLFFFCQTTHAQFIRTTNPILKLSGSCSYYCKAETTANAGFAGSVSNGITGWSRGTNNGGFSTQFFSGSVTFINQTEPKATIDGFPISYNVSHSWRSIFSGDNRLNHPNLYASCNTGGGSGGGGGTGGGGTCDTGGGLDDDFSWDPLNDDSSCVSPILIDLGDQNIECGGEQDAIVFDLWGNGKPILMNWVGKHNDDAFLVHDLNGNGIVDDGSELFGNGTRLILQDNKLAINGFLGLAQFDDPQLGGNGDTYVGPEDMVWQDLYLWNDFNADGFTDPGEMKPLSFYDFVALDTIPKERRLFDEHGNWFRFWAGAESTKGERLMIDVFFVAH